MWLDKRKIAPDTFIAVVSGNSRPKKPGLLPTPPAEAQSKKTGPPAAAKKQGRI
jgi:hypothetical protein